MLPNSKNFNGKLQKNKTIDYVHTHKNVAKRIALN